MKRLINGVICIFLVFCVLVSCKAKVASGPEKLTARIHNDQVYLFWTPDENAESYRIYRKQRDDNDYKFICDCTLAEYTDNTAEAEIAYIYKVTSIGKNGESAGTQSNEILLKTKLTSAEISTPVITSVTKSDKFTNVIIFEDSNLNCTYEISRSLNENGEYEIIGITHYKSFYDSDAQGKMYYYTVTAVSGVNKGSASEPVITGTNEKAVYSVPVFMYHEFVTPEDLKNGVAFDEYSIYKDEFEQDLIWLKDNGYTTITCAELADFLEGKGDLPAKPVILTIDDGKFGVYKNAYPLFKKYNMKAVLAVIGERIDEATDKPETRYDDIAPYCTWDEIGEMSNSGTVEIVSHTYNLHVYNHNNRQGANCADGETVDTFFLSAKSDYDRVQKKLLQVTGKETVSLSYPYSKRSAVSDNAWLKCGYKILLAGSEDEVSKTYINYLVREAGINSDSATLRRIVRFNGTPISKYINNAIESDK